MIGPPEVLTDLASVERILPDWRALAAASARSGLESPDWLLPLARRYLAADEMRFLAWRREEQLVGVAPYSLVRGRVGVVPLRQLFPWGTAGPRMRGLVDLVATDDAREEVLDGLATWLRGSREWDLLRVVRPQFGSPTPARLRRAAGDAGWTYAPYSNLRSTTYQLDLPASVEEWEKFLRPKTRATARREARRFASELGGELVADVATGDLGPALDAVESLLTTRWGAGEVYFHSDPRFRQLVHEAVPQMAANGDAWVSLARDPAGIQACLVSIAQNGYAMALLVAANDDESYRKFSLGKHVFNMGIGEAVRRGCHTYDFLWVGGYKETYWHAVPRELESAMVGRGIVGRLAARLLAAREGGGLRLRR